MTTNTTSSPISDTVMRRIRTVHAMRMYAPIISGFAVFALALYGIGREVWVAKVFENVRAVAHAGDAARYIADAFIHTDTVVQALSILALAAFVWFVTGIIRNLQSFTRFA